MGNTLYLECSAGISGDMFTAALLDLGADETVLKETLLSLQVDGFQIRISRVKKSGIAACDFSVLLDPKHENRDHDMEYLHGNDDMEQGHKSTHFHDEHNMEQGHKSTHSHDEHNMEQEHKSAHSHNEHIMVQNQESAHFHYTHHEHRGLKEILAIRDNSHMTERSRELFERIFRILAEAEAKAHETEPEQVHFHEVGAVDSIVDIAAAAVCLDNLDIDKVVVTELNEGRGSVRCQHGILPVPVPAVVSIAAAYGLPLHRMKVEGEFITPTGAAIAAAIRTCDHLPETFVIKRIGIGAGKRTYERPSLLRAFLIEETGTKQTDLEGSATLGAGSICKLETNIDDCTGEALGHVMERLFETGAKDVHMIPIYMKKNRPAWQLNVICEPVLVPALERVLFEETTTIGIRRIQMERTVLKREIQTYDTTFGTVRVKKCELPSGVRFYPEYDDVAALCKVHRMSYPDLYRMIQQECFETLGQTDKVSTIKGQRKSKTERKNHDKKKIRQEKESR